VVQCREGIKLMSLLDIIKGLFTGQPGSDSRQSGNAALVVKPSTISKTSSSLQKIADVESKCPYCGCTLEKRPVRKKKCTNCGNFILVRTRPGDSQKVLVTEQQAAQIQRQWQHRMPEELERDPEYRQMSAKLRVNRGTEPSVEDVCWALPNERSLQHARKRDWGLYRNEKLDMAGVLEYEDRLRDALQMYLEICYLDVNGPTNGGGPRASFDPTQAFIAPGIIWEVRELSDNLGLETAEVKSLFIERGEIVHHSLRLPIAPAKAWDQIELELRVARSRPTKPQ